MTTVRPDGCFLTPYTAFWSTIDTLWTHPSPYSEHERIIPSLKSTTANCGTFPKLRGCIYFVPLSKSGGSTKSSVCLSTTKISPLLKNRITKSSFDESANFTY